MTFLLRRAFAIVAVVAQIAMPVAACAMAAHARPATDYCTATGEAGTRLPATSRAPLPATDHDGCTQSGCCAGVVTPVLTPPPGAMVVVRVDVLLGRVPVPAPGRPTTLGRYHARPRGPPSPA
jgi:hypothetical protein